MSSILEAAAAVRWRVLTVVIEPTRPAAGVLAGIAAGQKWNAV
jgi:hypothetical protein